MRTVSRPVTGQIAFVRQRRYLVEDSNPPVSARDSTLVRLSCVDDDNQGVPLEVLWEREVDAFLPKDENWDEIAKRGFDPAKLFASYYHTLKWNCVTSTDPKLFQSPFRAGIKLDSYQLEPLRKALRLPRVNLFIADDVGLGKTIEAGLIARELLLRKKVKEIVVACPPSMLLQWRDELETRFGLTFEIIDKEYIKKVRRERGFGVNPWNTHSRFLVSHRLLIDESYTATLLDWLGEFRSSTLLILDEAHHAAPASGQKYAIDSQFTRAIEELAKRFEHRLFLSATPHNGHSNSFSRLLEILDPQRFCRGVPVRQKMLDDIMVRRLKDDLRQIQGGFPERIVKQHSIEGLSKDAAELKLFQLLDDYRKLREERLSGESRRKQAASGILLTGLQQRLLSSIEAFARTLKIHRRTVEKQFDEGIKEVPKTDQFDLLTGIVTNDDDRATFSGEQLEAEEDSQIAAATASAMADTGTSSRKQFEKELKLLDEMTNLAEDARNKPDARIKALSDWIRQNMCENKTWNNIRVLIFTEYDATKRYLLKQLEPFVDKTERGNERIAVFHGPTPADERQRIKDAFNADPKKHPLRILIATDAAREGLNLQAHCHHLFHFDVPWNPSRMEQRNGRIDRKLQEQPQVFCHYFFYTQRPEDRVISALVRKSEQIKKELGSMNTVLDMKLIKTMQKGIHRDQVDAMEMEIESTDLDADKKKSIDDELEASRLRQGELREQIDQLRTLLDRSKESIGLNDEQFQQAISSSLELLGSAALKPLANQEEGMPERLAFPAIDQREGADSSWADTVDTLRKRRDPSQKLWEWRKEAPIRPVVFADAGKVDDTVVHLHLEHRVVQRLLGRFMAQGFVHHDLSRACLAQTSDAIPRVILLGRLCLYGPGAARLHEELIPVTAQWRDQQIRKGSLKPYAKDAESKTLVLLDEALLKGLGKTITKEVQKQLQQSAPGDIEDLLPALQSRGEEYAKDAEKKLVERGDTEAKAMKEILETQKKHIADTDSKLKKASRDQLRFDFGEEPDELEQLKANQRYWEKRLKSIETELTSEPERIREQYRVKARRVEPVGIVYLWPVTG